MIDVWRKSSMRRILKMGIRRPFALLQWSLISKAFRILYRYGWKEFCKKTLSALNRGPIAETYENWSLLYDTLTGEDRKKIRIEIAGFAVKPLISVILPTTENVADLILKSVQSVRAQLYPHWELCIVTDCSKPETISEELRALAREDRRIRLLRPEQAEDVSATLNKAISLASADFIALLSANDELAEHALYWVANEIMAHPDADLIFSDEDSVDSSGKRANPFFKPDWNSALMLSCNAFGHLGIFRKSLVESVKGFRPGFKKNADYDLVLRCALQTQSSRIRHISRVLYHQRVSGEAAAAPQGMTDSIAGRRAIEEFLAKKGIAAQVTICAQQCYQVDYATPTPLPRVSVLIPTTGNPAVFVPCLQSVLERTTYENYEVLILVNEVQFEITERSQLLAEAAAGTRVKVLSYTDRPFNYSWINNWGARQAEGEVLVLLNDDTEIITPDWIEKLIARISLSGVGAAGPMMYYPNDTIQHAGVILGIGGVASHVFRGEPRGSGGYFGRARLEQDLSCVTAGCMAIRKDVFFKIGALDETLAVAFNDVDLCIRLRRAGWRIIWTPTVELYHKESETLGRHDAGKRAEQHLADVALMRSRWAPILDADPYYNRNLSLRHPFEFAFPPR